MSLKKEISDAERVAFHFLYWSHNILILFENVILYIKNAYKRGFIERGKTLLNMVVVLKVNVDTR